MQTIVGEYMSDKVKEFIQRQLDHIEEIEKHLFMAIDSRKSGKGMWSKEDVDELQKKYSSFELKY